QIIYRNSIVQVFQTAQRPGIRPKRKAYRAFLQDHNNTVQYTRYMVPDPEQDCTDAHPRQVMVRRGMYTEKRTPQQPITHATETTGPFSYYDEYKFQQ